MLLIDKLLLLLLVMMLPIGVLASRSLMAKQQKEAAETSGIAQLDKTLEKLANGQNQVASVPQTPPIEIMSVVEASAAGALRISGMVPKGGVSMKVTTTVLPADAAPEIVTTKDVSGGVLGQAVEMRAVRTKSDGGFIYEYPISGVHGIVELQFEQAGSSQVVQYNLDTHKRVR